MLKLWYCSRLPCMECSTLLSMNPSIIRALPPRQYYSSTLPVILLVSQKDTSFSSSSFLSIEECFCQPVLRMGAMLSNPVDASTKAEIEELIKVQNRSSDILFSGSRLFVLSHSTSILRSLLFLFILSSSLSSFSSSVLLIFSPLLSSRLKKAVLKTFTTQYTKAYVLSLVAKLKDDVRAPPATKWKLLERPVRQIPSSFFRNPLLYPLLIFALILFI